MAKGNLGIVTEDKRGAPSAKNAALQTHNLKRRAPKPDTGKASRIITTKDVKGKK